MPISAMAEIPKTALPMQASLGRRHTPVPCDSRSAMAVRQRERAASRDHRSACQAPRCIMQSVSTGILESGAGKVRRQDAVCL